MVIDMASVQLAHVCGHTFISNKLNVSSVVLDLGANRGNFAREVFERWGCNVHAVEPTPELAMKLQSIDGIQVHQKAVSAMGGDVFFSIDPANCEASCIVDAPNENSILVSGETLNALLEKIGRVDLVKMDVEGAEVGILNCTPDSVLQKLPQISVEFHDFKQGAGITREMVLEVFARKKKLGFDVYVNSFWTNGDVLFVNQNILMIPFFSKIAFRLKGRWVPGIKRVLRRSGVI